MGGCVAAPEYGDFPDFAWCEICETYAIANKLNSITSAAEIPLFK